MKRKTKIYLWLLRLIEPIYLKLKQNCQNELSRMKRLASLKLGYEKWLWFQEYKRQRGIRAPSTKRTPLLSEQIEKKRQADCCHLKGRGLSIGIKDFNIWMHNYPDGRFLVRCLSCRKDWWQDLTTKEEWDIVVKPMMVSTTNTVTAGERVLHLPNAGKIRRIDLSKEGE